MRSRVRLRPLVYSLLVTATLVLAAAWTSARVAEPPAVATGVKALVGGRLIDGFGGPPIGDSVVLIRGDRITAVGRVGELSIPEDAEVISTEGMDVLPGLWDAHVHLMIVGHSDYAHWDRTYPSMLRDTIMPASAEQLLLAGVTSARDMGAPLDDILAVRDAIAAGKIPGPTLYVSGPFLQHEPYPGTEAFRWGVSGPNDARVKVKQLANAGVDFIKLIDQDEMGLGEVHAVVDEAHAQGLSVVAHSHRLLEIDYGLAAGVDCFEHTGLGTAPEYPADIFEGIAKRANTLYWTPTVAPLLLYEETRANPERLDDPRWKRGLPEDVVADVARSLLHWDRLSYYQVIPQRSPTVARKFEQLREAGVIMLIGTDSGVPGVFHSDSTWRELETWVNRFGIDPMDAIRSATYWPAVQMGVIDRVGTVSEGKMADIVAVRGDVLRHIDRLSDVDLVIKGGKRYK